MISINISIKKEAYEFLKQLKGKKMSFSDVILRFKKETNPIMRYFGALKHLDWDAKEKRMREFRKEFDKRLSAISY